MAVVEMKGREEEVTKTCGLETENKLLLLVGNDDDDIAIILI
jgi:hypothetical protein